MKVDAWVRMVAAVMVIGGFAIESGCTRVNSDSTSGSLRFAAQDGSGQYPHSSSFKTTRAHGEAFRKDAKSCTSCHGEQLDGGVSKARSCKSCHEAYPHQEQFKRSAEHGLRYRSSPEKCTSCHGEQLDGGPSKLTSCNQCHTAYPHTETFKKTSNHGDSFLSDRSSCLRCHSVSEAAANAKRDTKAACQKCHSYPHEARWSIPAQHGAAFIEQQKTPDQSCLNCHGENSSFSKRHEQEFVSCKSCHIPLPHDKGFKKGNKVHKAAAETYEGKCTSCHSGFTRLMPNMDGQGCMYCHEEVVLKIQWVDATPPKAESKTE